MPYQILPNILFIFAILGIVLIILRRLPEAVSSLEEHERPADENLSAKGLPAKAVSHVRGILKLWTKKTWNFILEAKDLKPNAVASYKIKKMFGSRPAQAPVVSQQSESQTHGSAGTAHAAEPVVKNEQYHLDLIKQDPKNLVHYHELGKFYLDRGGISDATDIYRYLTNHEPTNAEFHSKLAYCFYKLHEYEKATEHYQQSIALDSSQPNRYYNLGVSLEAEGKVPEAAEKIQQAISMEPGNIKYYLTLSNIYAKAGERLKSRSVLLKAKRVDPANPQVMERLKSVV